MPQKQLTSLLPNEVLARVERMRIQAGRRFTTPQRGDHRSRGGGRSIEFRDYRDYADGDDIRFLDWNLFARLRRPYIKLFHDEEELCVAILVDATSSMRFDDKLERAKQLAAAFGIMGLVAGERVSVHAFHEPGTAPRSLTRLRGRNSMRPLFRFLEDLEPSGNAPLERGIDSMLKVHRGRGVAVIVSDFLTVADLGPMLNLLLARGLETFGLQVLGASEIAPEIDADLRLVDCETAGTLDVAAGDDLLALYHDHRLAYEDRLRSQCRSRHGRFLTVDARRPVAALLFEDLRRAGWLR